VYPLDTWFVSGIRVWTPCIKETMMMMMMMMIMMIIVVGIVELENVHIPHFYPLKGMRVQLILSL
jgi:hypothetical protein